MCFPLVKRGPCNICKSFNLIAAKSCSSCAFSVPNMTTNCCSSIHSTPLAQSTCEPIDQMHITDHMLRGRLHFDHHFLTYYFGVLIILHMLIVYALKVFFPFNKSTFFFLQEPNTEFLISFRMNTLL